MSMNLYCDHQTPCVCSIKGDCRECIYENNDSPCPFSCDVCLNKIPYDMLDKSRKSEYSNNTNWK